MKQQILLFSFLFLCGLNRALPAQRTAYGSVFISEIMADPDPPAGLAMEEYLELMNRSTAPISLLGWVLELNGRPYALPDTLLEAGGFLLVSGIRLPNTGAELGIRGGDGGLVFGTRYGGEVAGPDWKSEGGWAMEWSDTGQLCYAEGLWSWSTDLSGGTPGRPNSVSVRVPDTNPPAFLFASAFRGDSIQLHFSEVVRYGFHAGACVLQPGNRPALSMAASEPVEESLTLKFARESAAQGNAWLMMPAVKDCAGNGSANFRIPIGPALVPGPGAALLSEVMFNPLPGSPEYIELYNPGPAFIDLNDLIIDVVGEGEELLDPVALSEESRLWPPLAYLVLCPSVRELSASYGLSASGVWVEMSRWRILSNAGGRIMLCDRAGNLVDDAFFNEDMHAAIVAETQGVSLERMSFQRRGDEAGNWHSASSAARYCTPGTRNSQQQDAGGAEDWLEYGPEVFSPDNDGYKDVLTLKFSESVQGWLLRIEVVDEAGRPVMTLANNSLAGTGSLFSWDGRSEEGHLQSEGLYVLLIRAWDPVSGERKRKRLAIGLVYP